LRLHVVQRGCRGRLWQLPLCRRRHVGLDPPCPVVQVVVDRQAALDRGHQALQVGRCRLHTQLQLAERQAGHLLAEPGRHGVGAASRVGGALA
jgi:hypothetical protein